MHASLPHGLCGPLADNEQTLSDLSRRHRNAHQQGCNDSRTIDLTESNCFVRNSVIFCGERKIKQNVKQNLRIGYRCRLIRLISTKIGWEENLEKSVYLGCEIEDLVYYDDDDDGRRRRRRQQYTC